MVRLGEGRDDSRLARVLRCKMVELPIKYLGLPLRAIYKDERTWLPVVVRMKIGGLEESGVKLTLNKIR